MKKILFLSLCLLAAGAQAQEIRETQASMSKGSNTAFMMEIPGTKAEELRESWARFMKEYDAKTKYDKKLNESFTDNAIISAISDNSVDVYAQFQQSGNVTRMMAWFDLGGAFLNSQMHAGKVPAATALLKKYAKSVSRTMQEEVIKQEKRKLEDLNDEMKDLQKQHTGFERDIEGYKKDIENYKKKIAEAENNIETTKGKIEQNLNEQKKKSEEVGKQTEKLEKEEDVLKEMK